MAPALWIKVGGLEEGREHMSRLVRVLDDNDVVERLRLSVKRAGGQSAFARQTGLDRSHLNFVLAGKRLPSWSIIDTLNLGVVYVALGQYDGLAVRKLRPRRRQVIA
jgi:DNA-binding phage protein